jgi:putative effector of murein hydrolase LrgA (UPF0299 family)
MGLKHTSLHAGSTDSQWAVVRTVILIVSALWVLLATGCVAKPVYRGSEARATPCR